MSGADQGLGKPKGWYGKAARSERKAVREVARAARAAKAKPLHNAQAEALRASAARLLDRLPQGRRNHVPTVAEIREREGLRVAGMLKRDRSDARRERKRAEAAKQVREGKTANLQDTVVTPTPEQLRQAEYRPVRIEKLPGSVAVAETVRRVTANRVKQLYDRGVFSDDTYPAVLWFRRQWEAAQMGGAAGVSQYGERAGGGAVFHARLPRSAAAVEAWDQYWFARGFIAADMLATFEKVVLEEMPVADAARAARCRFSNVERMLQAAALSLLGGIVHLLPVRAADGQEIVPPEDTGIVTEIERREVDPIMLDERGMFRPADELAAIARGRGMGVADDEILAMLDGGR